VNVLLIPLGSSGDVNPFVAIGRALQERGHRVTMITSGYFEPVARRAGFAFESLGAAADYLSVIENPDLWKPMPGFKLVADWVILGPMRRIYELIADRFVAGHTVVVATGAIGARIAQEKLGAPLVSLVLQPAMFRSLTDVSKLGGLPVSSRMPRAWNAMLYWLADRAVVEPLIGPEVSRFRATLGLPRVRRHLDGWWFSRQRIVGLFPEWFTPRASDWPEQVELTGFPLYDEDEETPAVPGLDEFMNGGEPPVVFTPGSAMAQGREFFEAAVAACRLSGRRGVLVSRFLDQVPAELPQSVRAFDFVPFSRLFPRAAAVVHHGGIGTMSQGLAAGVPQLVMPMAHDQFDNAARLERLGAGGTLGRRQFQAPRVASMLDRLIGSAKVNAQCKTIAAQVRDADAMPETCRLIEETAEQPRYRLVLP
jgi:UDP:flavonoid glycosyltransferase YjiC (YdhE family)